MRQPPKKVQPQLRVLSPQGNGRDRGSSCSGDMNAAFFLGSCCHGS